MGGIRHHATTLIAGLVVFGVLALVALSAFAVVDASMTVRGAVWFVGAFLGAHLAKRLLIDLETTTLCVASVLVILIAVGLQARRDGAALDASDALQLGVTLAGSLAGAFTAATPTVVRPVFALLGAGAAGFGASMLVVGISLVFTNEDAGVVGFLIGVPVGSAIVALGANVRPRYVAFGQMLFFTVLVVVLSIRDGFEPANATTPFTMLALSAFGAAVAYRFKPEPRPDLPEARQL